MQNTSTTLRLIALFIDLALFTLVLMPFVAVCMFLNMGSSLYFHTFTFSLFFSMILCKDLIGGRSYGKRKVQLEIRNTRSDAHIPSWRLILRNVFMIIWPIECLMLIFSPLKRLGDYAASTEVVLTEREDHLKVQIKDYIAFVITLFLVYIISYWTAVTLFAGTITLLYEN